MTLRIDTNDEHAWFDEQIAVYLAGGLEAAERARLESHAAACSTCAQELRRATEIEKRMTGLFADVAPAADFEDRMIARLRFKLPKRRYWIHPAIRKAAVASAAVLVIGGVGFVGSEYLDTGKLPTWSSNVVQRVRAATNLRQIGQAILLYSSENRQTYPRSLVRYGNNQDKDRRNVLHRDGHTEFQANPLSGDEQDVSEVVHSLIHAHGITGDRLTVPSSNAEKWDFAGGTNAATKWSKSGADSKPQRALNYSDQDPQSEQPGVGGRPSVLAGVDGAPDGTGAMPQTRFKPSDFAMAAQAPASATKEDAGTKSQAAEQRIRYNDLLKYPHNWPDLSGMRDRTVAMERGERAEDLAVATSLERKLPEVRFDKTALADVVDFMRDVSTANIFVDWRSLEKVGITRDTPITGQFRDVKMRDALATILADAAKGATKPTIEVDEGVITITTPATQAENQPAATQPVGAGAAGGAAAVAATAAAPSLRKVIREGVMEFEVESFDSAFTQISKITEEEGGFIAAADSDKLPNGKVRGSVTVRVLPNRLDTLVLKLRALGELKSQRLGSKDISKQYTDLESELRAARAMEERLLEMIRTAQGKVKELLEAEKELGNWRTKIEQIQGQLNYYNNLVSMATLTITAYEKDIKTPASASITEEINTGVETDDVEAARSQAIKSIDEAKGRIIESELKQLEAGQLAAKIVAEVPSESAGAIVDRLRQLGKIARLDIQRKQTETPQAQGTRSLGPAKIETAPTRIIISMYNLANVAPRLTTNLNLAGEDVEAVYRAILKRVRDAQGRILTSNLSRQDATQAKGSIQFEIRAADADAVLNDVRAAGQVLALNVAENPDTQNVTTAKQAFTVSIIPASQVPPRETRSISVQTSDVESAVQSINSAIGTTGGRVLESSMSQDAGGRTVARLVLEVPLGKADQLVDVAKQSGKVRTAESSKNAQIPDGPLARARLNLTLGSGESIVPAERGFWQSIREGLATSVQGLLWSLQLIVIGLCLVGPWALLVWGGWRFAARTRRMKAEG